MGNMTVEEMFIVTKRDGKGKEREKEKGWW